MVVRGQMKMRKQEDQVQGLKGRARRNSTKNTGRERWKESCKRFSTKDFSLRWNENRKTAIKENEEVSPC